MTKSDEKSYEDVKITNKDEVIDNKSKESEVVIRHFCTNPLHLHFFHKTLVLC